MPFRSSTIRTHSGCLTFNSRRVARNIADVSSSPVHLNRAKVSADDKHAAGNSGVPGKEDLIIIQGLLESPANPPKERILADLEQFREFINKMLQPSEEIIILKACCLGSHPTDTTATPQCRPRRQ
ncbi:unnamed protein product [Schistocephalus solidus]|uniref:Uncharacterized protein n=1 Tax=Schistocephalus solidus TaxID=70667 RepID=A0A183SK27_SCHSO|nr:unnamed protein product [Schistocephalus solidus]